MMPRHDIDAATDRIVEIARLRPDRHPRDRARREKIRRELEQLINGASA